ncbi:hypothetical protein FLONG3_10608 [Fusarium longipes]|uniref:F-box domain-containing protein n=1 Tax=Fusarium longipes TaxID=694270 RepID=A0A395RMZ9_9HYPO|nr:hypothetical protein FLONG3_10608 [Fusarium longipes]
MSSQISTFNLEALPTELLLKIFHAMKYRAAGRLVRTSKTMYRLLNHDLYKRTENQGWFPMGFAAATNNLRTMELCLEAGATIDTHITKDVGYHRWNGDSCYLVGGWRALREALYRMHVDAVKWLLEKGADPNMTDVESEKWLIKDVPLAFAFRQGNSEGDKALRAREVCIALVRAGASMSPLTEHVRNEIEHIVNDDTYIPKNLLRTALPFLYFGVSRQKLRRSCLSEQNLKRNELCQKRFLKDHKSEEDLQAGRKSSFKSERALTPIAPEKAVLELGQISSESALGLGKISP